MQKENSKKEVTVVALMGFKKSGKTTSASFLKTYFQEDASITVKQLSFSKALKSSLSKEMNIDVNILNDHDKKEKYRMHMQLHGDLLKEKFGNDFFVNEVSEEITALTAEAKLENKRLFIIFDDVRFEQEANFIRSFQKNILIRIVRLHDGVTENTPDYDIKYNPVNHGKFHEDAHISEIAQNFIQADLRVYNGSNSLKSLHSILRMAMTTAKIRNSVY